ncbi:hypothetical protein [Actinoallomurus soli]|uniref:hypothetical protein n=1 Tax=Actinoallomurus soli TaxID=2952535 RepID=UPI00209228E8|nr:hypothetical protein [Actinoallomurus soli]MCO5974619.1 hypothetical protein [Actinoallomurus soli]
MDSNDDNPLSASRQLAIWKRMTGEAPADISSDVATVYAGLENSLRQHRPFDLTGYGTSYVTILHWVGGHCRP